MTNKIKLVLALGYFMVCAMTYGYASAEYKRSNCEDPKAFICQYEGPEPFIKSLIWPIYWPYHLSAKAFNDES